MPVSKAFFALLLTRLQHPEQNVDMEVKKKPQKKASVPHQKGGFLFLEGGREGSAAVSSHWRGQRGEFPVLHHSDGCVQLHYVRAAGSPGCRGRGSRCSAPIGPGVPAKVSGSGPRWDTGLALRPAGLAGQRGAAVVSQMIYRGLGWREY